MDSENLVASGIKPETSGSAARHSDRETTEAVGRAHSITIFEGVAVRRVFAIQRGDATEDWRKLQEEFEVFMVSSGMLRRVDLVRTDVSEERSARFLRNICSYKSHTA
jgi:hypothetical protein